MRKLNCSTKLPRLENVVYQRFAEGGGLSSYPQLLAQNRRLGGIHAVKLENVLRRIHADADNLFHGRSPVSEINNNGLILARSMPPGAVHTNNSDTGDEFDVRRMFRSESPRIHLDETVQAPRGAAPTGHGWQGSEFATSIKVCETGHSAYLPACVGLRLHRE
jgi:hypothetical protein